MRVNVDMPASRAPAVARTRTPSSLIKPTVFLVCLGPLALILADILLDRLGANPVEELSHATGLWALRFLLITLAVTPLRRMLGWNDLGRFRRMFGLYAFFYATLHILVYVVLDQGLHLESILDDVLKRPYIVLGLITFVLLVPLAATSTNGMMKRLGGRNWRRLHRLVYACGVGSVAHYLWLVKADLRPPLTYLLILAVLLALRTPALKRVRVPRGIPAVFR